MVPPNVFRLRPDSPRTFGVDVSRDLQIHVVIDGEIVSSVGEIQTSGIVIAESRHQNTAGVTVGDREESKGDGQR